MTTIFTAIARAVALSLAIAPSPAAAITVSPSCRDAAPGQRIPDPEFVSSSLLAAWQVNPVFDAKGVVVENGQVVIAPVDSNTGLILTSRATGFPTADPVDLAITKNGPEWGCTRKNCSLYFTSYLPDRSGGRLAKLAENRDGIWRVTFLRGGEGKMFHVASVDASSSDPAKIYYANVQVLDEISLDAAVYGWRADQRPAVDHIIPRGSTPARWAPGSDDLILRLSVRTRSGFVDKLARFDTTTRTAEILMDDSKLRQQPFP